MAGRRGANRECRDRAVEVVRTEEVAESQEVTYTKIK
jgi:hypothetical protein